MKHIPTPDDIEQLQQDLLANTQTAPGWVHRDNIIASKQCVAAVLDKLNAMGEGDFEITRDNLELIAGMGHMHGFMLGVYAATHGWETGQ